MPSLGRSVLTVPVILNGSSPFACSIAYDDSSPIDPGAFVELRFGSLVAHEFVSVASWTATVTVGVAVFDETSEEVEAVLALAPPLGSIWVDGVWWTNGPVQRKP